MDSTFKQLQNNGDIKIKETKTVIRVENDAYYSLAIETLNRKYDLLVEQKAERESQKKQERLEKLRQKRLEKKGNK
jgi:Trm5-related predicted tRNA methylase